MTTVVGVGAAVAAGALALGLGGAALAAEQAPPRVLTAQVRGTVSTPEGTVPHAFLTIQTWPDSMAGPHGTDGGPHPSWVTYGPTTNLSVPAHALVTVTVEQYDTGGTITNPYFAQVHGTVGGTETVDGKTVTSINPDEVGHTFTLHGTVEDGQDSLFVNAPCPPCRTTPPTRRTAIPSHTSSPSPS